MNSVYKLPQDANGEHHIHWKTGIRVLAISESFRKGDTYSYVAGVVMRGDLRIDGFSFCRPTVGGSDATEKVLGLYRTLNRQDLRAWLLGGSIISWFNTIDIHQLLRETKLPVVCVSYWPSEGLEKYVREYFPQDWQNRMKTIESVGEREEIILSERFKVFITRAGMDLHSARSLVNHFTRDGRIPEPIRVARQLAASIRKFHLQSENSRVL
ncbi:MAG: DUF99 family protein [Candidatus Thorarchaeota archaeon]